MVLLREPNGLIQEESTTGRQQELSGFIAELAEQARRRQALLKRQVDEELADTISERRIQVEKTLHRLHTSHDRLRRVGLKANRRTAERRMAEERDRLRTLLLKELEKRVVFKIRNLKGSEEYRLVLRALTQEAASVLGDALVVRVEKGDAEALKDCACVAELQETLSDAWGGVCATDATKDRVIDNSFRVRWKRLLPKMMRRLSEHVDRYAAVWLEELEAKGWREDGPCETDPL